MCSHKLHDTADQNKRILVQNASGMEISEVQFYVKSTQETVELNHINARVFLGVSITGKLKLDCKHEMKAIKI